MQRKILIPALLMAAGVATAGALAYAQQPAVTQNDAMADLDGVVVGCGPGPFTGLRVGMATAAAYGQELTFEHA